MLVLVLAVSVVPVAVAVEEAAILLDDFCCLLFVFDGGTNTAEVGDDSVDNERSDSTDSDGQGDDGVLSSSRRRSSDSGNKEAIEEPVEEGGVEAEAADRGGGDEGVIGLEDTIEVFNAKFLFFESPLSTMSRSRSCSSASRCCRPATTALFGSCGEGDSSKVGRATK